MALWAGLLFVGSPLFLSQGFRIRSDVLACFLQLVSLCHYLWIRKVTAHKAGFAFNIFLNILVLFATPKGIFQVAVNIVFIFFFEKRQKTVLNKKYIGAVVGGLGVLFLAFVAWKREQFATAAVFFLQSYFPSEHHPGFLSLESFRFVLEALAHHVHYILFFVLAFATAKELRVPCRYPEVRGAAMAALLLILLHNDRLPFFIFSLSVFPILYLALKSYDVFEALKREKPKAAKNLVSLFTVLVLVGAGGVIGSIFNQQNNKAQAQLQQQMETYLKTYPRSVYYDAVGVLPRNTQIFIFPAPMHFGNSQEVLGIPSNPELDLVFFSNRLFYYFNDFYLALENNYFIQVGAGVFAKSRVLEKGQELTEQKWKQYCTELKADQLYLYEGPLFLQMKPKGNSVSYSCSEAAPKISTQEEFMALSRYPTFQIPNDKSFAQIFDSGL